MKPVQRLLVALLMLFTFVSLACQTATNLVITPTPTASLTPTITLTPTRTPRPTQTFTPTPTPLVIQVENMRKLRSGGFSFAVLDGLKTEIGNHDVLMYSEDDKLNIYLLAQVPYPGEHINTSLKHYMEWANKQFRNVVEGERQAFTHAGVEGTGTSFSGLTKDGEPFQARAAFMRPEQGKMLTLLVYAYGEGAWEQFGEKAYQTTLDKLTFFEITPWEGCPISTDGSYGFSDRNPVPLGGELLLGPNREEEYLSALLGKDGEVVFYSRIDSVEVKGKTLDKYILRVGNGGSKTLFIDLYHAGPVLAPSGMTCSSPLPIPLGN